MVDTICSTTQNRQDAVRELVATRPDLLLVVGGYNSSNTGHLAEMAAADRIPTYHVAKAERLVDRDTIRH